MISTLKVLKNKKKVKIKINSLVERFLNFENSLYFSVYTLIFIKLRTTKVFLLRIFFCNIFPIKNPPFSFTKLLMSKIPHLPLTSETPAIYSLNLELFKCVYKSISNNTCFLSLLFACLIPKVIKRLILAMLSIKLPISILCFLRMRKVVQFFQLFHQCY